MACVVAWSVPCALLFCFPCSVRAVAVATPQGRRRRELRGDHFGCLFRTSPRIAVHATNRASIQTYSNRRAWPRKEDHFPLQTGGAIRFHVSSTSKYPNPIGWIYPPTWKQTITPPIVSRGKPWLSHPCVLTSTEGRTVLTWRSILMCMGHTSKIIQRTTQELMWLWQVTGHGGPSTWFHFADGGRSDLFEVTSFRRKRQPRGLELWARWLSVPRLQGGQSKRGRTLEKGEDPTRTSRTSFF